MNWGCELHGLSHMGVSDVVKRLSLNSFIFSRMRIRTLQASSLRKHKRRELEKHEQRSVCDEAHVWTVHELQHIQKETVLPYSNLRRLLLLETKHNPGSIKRDTSHSLRLILSKK